MIILDCLGQRCPLPVIALARAIRTALDAPAPGHAQRAAEALRPWRREHVDRVVAEQLLPRLLT